MAYHDAEDKFSALSKLSDTTASSKIIKEKLRLKNLSEYDLKFEFNDQELFEIAELAAQISGTSLRFVGVVGQKCTDFLSSYGCDIRQKPRETTFCHYLIRQDDFYEIKDTLVDERSKDLPFIKNQENIIRYYSGWPLKTKEGFNLGSLCVCSMDPYELAKVGETH